MPHDNQPELDAFVVELGLVREAGLEPLDVEGLLSQLPHLSELPVIQHRTRGNSALGRATAICRVVHEAAERLDQDPSDPLPDTHADLIGQAQMLMRVHFKTARLSPADARTAAQERSGLQERQFRRRHENRLLRLVAQGVLDLDHEDQISRWGRALAVGSDVPQSVAMYWLYLFRDHYFRMETAAYALQVDTETALSQLRDELPTWQSYLSVAIFFNVQFSLLRHRFWREHGPLWFAPTDEGCTRLNDAAELIEYHDPFPYEVMARLRRIYGQSPDTDHDDFTERLNAAGLAHDILNQAETWLRACVCPREDQVVVHGDRCQVGILVKNCDTFGQAVEEEFERIQEWYRSPRFAVDADIKDRILNFRTPAQVHLQAVDTQGGHDD